MKMKPTRALMRKRGPKVKSFSFNLPDRVKDIRAELAKLKNEEIREEQEVESVASQEELNVSNSSKRSLRSNNSKRSVRSNDSKKSLRSNGSKKSSNSQRYFTRSRASDSPSDENKPIEPEIMPSLYVKIKPIARNLAAQFFSPSMQTPKVVLKATNSSSDNLSNIPLLSDVSNDSSHIASSKRLAELNAASILQKSLKKTQNTTTDSSKANFVNGAIVKSLQNSILDSTIKPVEENEKHKFSGSLASSTSSTKRNLESRNEPVEKVKEKNIESLHWNVSRQPSSFRVEQISSRSEKKKIIDGHNKGVQREPEAAATSVHPSESEEDDDEGELVLQPLKMKHFSLSKEALQAIKRKRPMRVTYEIVPETNEKQNNLFSVPRAKRQKIVSQPSAVRDPVNVLLWKSGKGKRGIPQLTDLEVAYTVIFNTFREIRKEVKDQTQLFCLNKYEESVAKDITSMISKTVSLQQQEKNIRKVQKEIKLQSNEIAEAIDQAILDRKQRKEQDG